MNIKDMIEVLQAYERGEAIEFKREEDWQGVKGSPRWNFYSTEYRISPKKEVSTEEKYNELLYAVGNKYPNETRHETALRYIRKAEEPVTNAKKEMTLAEELRTLNPQFYSEWKDLAARAANRIEADVHEHIEMQKYIIQLESAIPTMRQRIEELQNKYDGYSIADYTADELLDELRGRCE
jgi:hypothetical protein